MITEERRRLLIFENAYDLNKLDLKEIVVFHFPC